MVVDLDSSMVDLDLIQLSRDAVAARLTLHAAAAATSCPSLTGKTITPHVLRHTAQLGSALRPAAYRPVRRTLSGPLIRPLMPLL